MAAKVRDALLRDGYSVYSEVPLMSQCIDIVAVDENSDRVLAIECKLRDWRRALTQVTSHRLACDEVAICLPLVDKRSAPLDQCQQSGVGLLLYDDEADSLTVVVEPTLIDQQWQPARSWLLAAIAACQHKGRGGSEI